VTDVAALCGYTDHSAFTRQFKAIVGVTPLEYRMLLHGATKS
jgi:AraC-like DNA-binding protein